MLHFLVRYPPDESHLTAIKIQMQAPHWSQFWAVTGIPFNSSSRDGTHKIEVSDIIIFMYSIQPSMHKTDTHNLFFKKNDQNTF